MQEVVPQSKNIKLKVKLRNLTRGAAKASSHTFCFRKPCKLQMHLKHLQQVLERKKQTSEQMHAINAVTELLISQNYSIINIRSFCFPINTEQRSHKKEQINVLSFLKFRYCFNEDAI